ncbi:hypothetical protein L2E82_31887 [Cichorium intybus]|uniref:Uncharacterized protein n=1 Tax=Cichorium intybus TaxID=13427 RepID=A0ACB9BEV9_CICIN|nr:hypothetical protein L2E82_31887 [Cichorium intybus]
MSLTINPKIRFYETPSTLNGIDFTFIRVTSFTDCLLDLGRGFGTSVLRIVFKTFESRVEIKGSSLTS